MASVVLAASNQASLTFSVWSGWTGTLHDLLLVAEVNMEKITYCELSQDGMIEAHCGLLFPMSRHLANLFETLPYTGGLTQVRMWLELAAVTASAFLPGGAGRNKDQSCGCCERSDLHRNLLFERGDSI